TDAYGVTGTASINVPGNVGNQSVLLQNESAQYKIQSIPDDYFIKQNYPNPFNPTTTISFSLPSKSFVTLKVYDILGREVSTLMNQEKEEGTYNVMFNASNLASGMYFYRIAATSLDGSNKNFVETKKMLLLK
ncbi:MAG TPA: T9SS type A sorting domain-containing protein, partial [Bacteroidota bacterium]|nr:T9SS type A sorting domain-containing protein [Bacteroidota bacterium]